MVMPPLWHALEKLEDAVKALAMDVRPLPDRLEAAYVALTGLHERELSVSPDMQRVYQEIGQAFSAAGTLKESIRLHTPEQALEVVRLIVNLRDRIRADVEGQK